jgi:hypothetical protein
VFETRVFLKIIEYFLNKPGIEISFQYFTAEAGIITFDNFFKFFKPSDFNDMTVFVYETETESQEIVFNRTIFMVKPKMQDVTFERYFASC